MTASNYSWKPLSWLQALLLLIALLQPILGHPQTSGAEQSIDSSRPRCRPVLEGGKTFCSEVDNYPQLDQLDSLMKREYSLFFEEDQALPQNITTITYEQDEAYLCESTERIIYPKAGKNKDADWLFILNDNQNFRQGVRVEECITPGRACKFADFFPIRFIATCKQNYTYRSLIAIMPNGTLTRHEFKFPSYCTCVLRRE